MLNKLHEILKDKDCSGNIRCFTWAFVCMMVYFSVFLYGFGVLELSMDVDDLLSKRDKSAEEKIGVLLTLNHEITRQLQNHRHKPFSGKIYFKPEPTTAK